MIQRQKDIILDLIHNSMSISEISKKHEVTERTIRSDIRQINKEICNFSACLQKNEDNDIYLDIKDDNLFSEFEQKELLTYDFDFSEPKNRTNYICLRFLFASSYIKLEDLMDEMYISRSTIQNDMRFVREYLSKFNLDFDARPNYGLKIIGIERDIRNAIASIIYKMNNTIIGNKATDIVNMFDKDGIDTIYDILVKNINESEIKLSDVALNNLVVHIAIAIKRIRINQYFQSKVDLDLQANDEYKIATNIVRDVEKSFDVVFPEDEITYITMHLMGTKLILKESEGIRLSKEENRLIAIAEKIIETVDKKLSYRLVGDRELLSSIVMHLKPAIYRFKNNMNIRNPLLDSIKVNYPVAYEASMIASDVLVEEMGINFNDDEIGYIAIHLGAAIERAKMEESPVRALLVCTTGVGSSKLLKYKLKSKFSDQIEIVDTTELYNIEKYRGVNLDLIITTVPFSQKPNVPYIFISDILGESTFEEIQNFLDKHKKKRKNKYLDVDDIYIDLEFESKEETLKYLTQEIVSKGKAPQDLYDLIMKRENIISTAFGNCVAIPHPFEMVTDETFLTIGVLKKPIKWDSKNVQIVIILNVAKEASGDFDDMYGILLDLIDSKENVQKIKKAKSKSQIFKLFNQE